jgi:hypothetical protein
MFIKFNSLNFVTHNICQWTALLLLSLTYLNLESPEIFKVCHRWQQYINWILSALSVNHFELQWWCRNVEHFIRELHFIVIFNHEVTNNLKNLIASWDIFGKLIYYLLYFDGYLRWNLDVANDKTVKPVQITNGKEWSAFIYILIKKRYGTLTNTSFQIIRTYS